MNQPCQAATKRYLNNLRMARILGGFSQDNLAAKIQVDPAIISRIERGVIKGTREQHGRLAKVLGIPEEDLFPKAGTEK